MNFVEKKIVYISDPSKYWTEDVAGTFLIGKSPILKWASGFTKFGHWENELFPAFHDGKRCFFKNRDWYPRENYCVKRKDDIILSYDEGIKLLIENGACEHLFSTCNSTPV